jgi:hypothetical protein
MSAVGFVIKHDDRFEYNPPKVERPAMSDEQFAFDNQREIEAGLLANPIVMAHMVMLLRDRVDELERKIDG